MRFALISLTFSVGLLLALHLAMNAAVGKIILNPRMGNAVFWSIGAVVAIVIGLSGWKGGFFVEAKKVPVWLWTAGGIGACMVFVIAVMIPQLGAGTTNIILLAGQVLGGLIIAHYGLFGSPIESIGLVRLFGLVIMIAGASIAVLNKIPFID